MRFLDLRLAILLGCLLFAANKAVAQPLIDDKFDDGDVTTNTLGNGSGWNRRGFGGSILTESGGVLDLSLNNSANAGALLSKETFSANGAQTMYGEFTFTEMVRPDARPEPPTTPARLGGRPGSTTTVQTPTPDGFDSFANAGQRSGLYVSFKVRSDDFGIPINGDQGALYYTTYDGSTFTPNLLASWTWDRSVFQLCGG